MAEHGDSPLAPYRVLDLTDEKGALCTRILADLGADVIKVERRGGDPSRRIGPFYHDIPDPERSLHWFTFNAGKRSITLDLDGSEGQEILRRLVKTADFLVESLAPGHLDGLGLGYDRLNEINSRIVVTSITPFGQTGPYRDYKAPDIVVQAMSGVMFITGDPDRPPVQMGGCQGYAMAGVHALMGTMIAHHSRQLTGRGQLVDVSMQECSAPANLMCMANWDLIKFIITRVGPSIKRADRHFRYIFPTRDGGFMAAMTTGEWQEPVTDWLDSKGMAADLKDPKWKGKGMLSGVEPLTQEEQDHMSEVLAAFVANHGKAELYREARERGIGWAPVNTCRDVLDNEQLQSRDFWTTVEHPELGEKLTYAGAPAKFSDSAVVIQRRPPLVGEHNQEVYCRELGFSREDLSLLREAGVI